MGEARGYELTGQHQVLEGLADERGSSQSTHAAGLQQGLAVTTPESHLAVILLHVVAALIHYRRSQGAWIRDPSKKRMGSDQVE